MSTFRMEEHNDLCVGIDLGTTNSVLATINEKPNGDIVSKVVDISRAVDMYNAVSGEAKLTTTKKPTLSSCVYYRQERNYAPLVGDFAKMQYPLRPHLVAKSIKSQMGRPQAEGLAPDIPDKTPAEISAQILKHLLKEASKVYRCNITDAVITVPANFDSAMCKATKDAAEMAGIKVKNEDGSERPVLLSEPNAVIYDLINQIHNGEIPDRILDLREKKRVLVFDLGGGTLDITIHEIRRRQENSSVLKVDEIATNRYTLLGGDDFDEELAKAMYARYLKSYEGHPEAVAKLRKEEKAIMSQLRVYGETLKLDLNEQCSSDYTSGWDDPDEETGLSAGGSMGGIGYSYDDTFKKEEVEKILSVFMAPELSYDDYKRIETITDTRNIIYPILDVLRKASEKLGVPDVTVDAVIVNGGMSKFYMVNDRLKEFFGFEPIVALDPDQAVARGAAVYHYYLHKYEEMKDDMRLLGQEAFKVENRTQMPIQWGNNILNDCLYLGVKNGAVHEIIPTGAELPYTSSVMTGFRIEAGQNKVAIPVKSRNLDGTYRIIANGNISFRQKYPDGAYVAFKVHMGSNKVITMKAWTSKDREGTQKIEEGYAEIVIADGGNSKVKTKIVAPTGSRLQPKEEINNIIQLCKNYEKSKNTQMRSKSAKRIASAVFSICNAGNLEEFAPVILEALRSVSSEEARQRMFVIARKLGDSWSDPQKRKLAAICINQLGTDLRGFSMGSGPRVSTNIQAIHAMSICADKEQLQKLSSLHKCSRYLQACLYTHAKTKTEIAWLKEEFEEDVRKSVNGYGSNIQFSSYAIGVALKNEADQENILSAAERGKIVGKMCHVISAGKLSADELTCCILALGWLCDQREKSSGIDEKILKEAYELIRNLEDFYSTLIILRQDKSRTVAMKLLSGDALNEDEEQFMLTKLER